MYVHIHCIHTVNVNLVAACSPELEPNDREKGETAVKHANMIQTLLHIMSCLRNRFVYLPIQEFQDLLTYSLIQYF
jgi:hypothetical protein